MEEEEVEKHLEALEDIALKEREICTGDIVPEIELLVCDKYDAEGYERCEKCYEFALVLSDIGRGDVIKMGSRRGGKLMGKCNLTLDDHPALIANEELQFVGRVLTDIEFADWFEDMYGFRP